MAGALPNGAPGVGVLGLDPSASELAGFTSLQAVLDFVAVGEDVRDALYGPLGTPTRPADLALVPRAAWDGIVAALRVDEAPLTPVQSGRLELLRRACRLTVGLAPGEWEPPVTATAPTAGVPPPLPQPVAGAGRSVKLSAILDQTLDAPLVPISAAEIRQLFADYKRARGAYPAADIEPTHDQLGAIRQIVAADSPPYADFAIFGPHGKRLAQKLVFVSFVHSPDGTWQRRELPGPPSFDGWWACWRVLRTALLLLDLADPERLDNYGEYVRGLHLRYREPAWFIIYTADVRMRSEHFERLRRILEERRSLAAAAGGPSPFETARPWNAVFAESILDKSWWDDAVRDPALLYLSKISSAWAAVDDGTAQPALDSASRGGPPQPRQPRQYAAATRPPEQQSQGPRVQRRKVAARQGPGADERRHTPRAGTPLAAERPARDVCHNFNRGACAEPCPRDFAHICSNCHGPHPVSSCPTADKLATKGKGGKGGRGKGSTS